MSYVHLHISSYELAITELKLYPPHYSYELCTIFEVNSNFNSAHQAAPGFTEQQRVLFQNPGGHREVCSTHCREVRPAVGSLDVFVAVINKH